MKMHAIHYFGLISMIIYHRESNTINCPIKDECFTQDPFVLINIHEVDLLVAMAVSHHSNQNANLCPLFIFD